MNYYRFTRIISLVTVMLLLVACGTSEPAPVQPVRAFHEAINSIEPGEETGAGMVEAGEGFNALVEAFQKYTTRPGAPMGFGSLAMAAGMVRFSNMEYELVSESAECAVVGAAGEMAIGDEVDPFEEDYVVVKQGGKWLIDLDAGSCD